MSDLVDLTAELSSSIKNLETLLEANKVDSSEPPLNFRPIQKYEFCDTLISGINLDGTDQLFFYEIKSYIKQLFPAIIEEHITRLLHRLKIILTVSPDQEHYYTLQNLSLDEISELHLITFSDAEKLFGMILNLIGKKQKLIPSIREKLDSIKIQHECFCNSGGGEEKIIGNFYFELPKDSRRIECCKCLQLFFPVDFVRHFHSFSDAAFESGSNISHLGFRSNNWRNYISVIYGQRDIQILDTLREILVLDDNSCRIKEDEKECPIWVFEEDVLNGGNHVNDGLKDLNGFEPILVELFRSFKFDTATITQIKELYDTSVIAHVQFQQNENIKLQRENDKLIKNLSEASQQLPNQISTNHN